jgi:hypothetical protein
MLKSTLLVEVYGHQQAVEISTQEVALTLERAKQVLEF